MEEIVALFCVCILTGIGWVAAKLCFAPFISDENCIYFAPALGMGICGVVAYLAVHTYQPWLIGGFCLAVAIIAFLFRARLRGAALSGDEASRLLLFIALTILALYGMQIVLYQLFAQLYPGPDEVWNLFNLTGVSPPDQMFGWHQAMFADQHRQYPQDPFFNDMDLYDRPQLGGYVTLFFFRLFRLPLTEDHFVYPPDGLHFYHCLWWLLNNLYLLGVAPLFRKLFGHRGAVIAVATTALGGCFFICVTGGWMKFAGTYPFLLALLLYLENQGPLLQAALCAVAYYIHGSILPFLAGFGVLQILNLRYPIGGRILTFRSVSLFAAGGVVLIGAWFVVVRWVGSKQPLLYYFIYGAGLTEAQTRPVAELAEAFYDRHTWASLSLFPLRNLVASWIPFVLLPTIRAALSSSTPIALSGLGNALFAFQRFCLECALGLVAAPIVIAGLFKTLARQYAGKITLCLYLIPTLIVALVYRIDWAFSLHILVFYHALCLFAWVAFLAPASTRYVVLALVLVAGEGMLCVLFAKTRFLPASALILSQLPASQIWWVVAYLLLVLWIIGAAVNELRRFKSADALEPRLATWKMVRLSTLKITVGLGITAVVIACYSIYCLRFYPR